MLQLLALDEEDLTTKINKERSKAIFSSYIFEQTF